jgi:hypothetical protein
VAVHPAYDDFDAFAPKTYMEIQKQDKWPQQLKYAAKASHNLGLNSCHF